jgi:hypothetical protein
MKMFRNCSIHTQNDDDLPLSDQQRASEEADNDAEEQDNMQMKLTLKESEDNFWIIDVTKQKMMEADLDLDRSMHTCQDADKALCIY